MTKETDGMRICYATITTADYLPRALILRDSVKRYAHKDLQILLVDHPEHVSDISRRISYPLISLDEVGCPRWPHMSFYYSKIELSCSLKPFLILYCLQKQQYDAVLFFDSDIEIYDTTDELESLLKQNEILMTPHIDSPLPNDGLYPSNYQIIVGGQLNTGFLGFRNTTENIELLRWLSSILEEACLQTESTASDQFWINLIISLSKNVHIIRSHRYNFAYWNMVQRKLWRDKNGKWQTDGGPLVFFHYSGFGADKPQELGYISTFQNRMLLQPGDSVYKLAREYRQKIVDSRYSLLADTVYHFGHFKDGTAISEYHRKSLLNLTKRERDLLGDPFAKKDLIERLVDDTGAEVYKKYIAMQHLRDELGSNYDQLQNARSELRRMSHEGQRPHADWTSEMAAALPSPRRGNGMAGSAVYLALFAPRRMSSHVFGRLYAHISAKPKLKEWSIRMVSRFPFLNARLRSFLVRLRDTSSGK